jgi:chorismate mutase
MEESAWRVRGVRGATTVTENSRVAIAQAARELADALLTVNQIQPEDIVMAVFSCTPDLNACFPSQTVREHFVGWEYVPLLDLAHLDIPGSLPNCLRIILQVNTRKTQAQMQPVYLQGARQLRPDLSFDLAQASLKSLC